MDNKQFLLDLLNMTDYVINKNIEAINIATNLNTQDLTADQKAQIRNAIITFAVNTENINLIIQVIDALTVMNQSFLRSFITLKTINLEKTDSAVQILTDILDTLRSL
jgi:hypothetical protein